jgi:hypothetical protein
VDSWVERKLRLVLLLCLLLLRLCLLLSLLYSVRQQMLYHLRLVL